MPRPPTGQTPLRNIRIPDALWRAAQQAAADRGETVTDVIKRSLERYVARANRRP